VTIPNYITFFRLSLVPLFCLVVFLYSPERTELRYVALGIYAVGGISDMLDGFIARRWNLRSQLGVRLDPLADKLLINLGFIFVAANDAFEPNFPKWFPALVLARDVYIVMGAYLIKRLAGHLVVRPKILGKITTFSLMVTLIAALLGLPFTLYLMAISIVFAVGSFLEYTVDGILQVYSRNATP
jgi:CDP-diacylglycerol--glycerol-3-phosphate 3-phosphatidyltransferase